MSALSGPVPTSVGRAQKKAFQAGRTQCREISIGDLKKYEELFLRFDSDTVGLSDESGDQVWPRENGCAANAFATESTYG
jgi:hypothetical protein